VTEHPQLRATIFGQVLAELLEKRGLEVTPFKVGKLAEEAGLDGWRLINRMADADAGDAGYLPATWTASQPPSSSPRRRRSSWPSPTASSVGRRT
jgi:hypothetical protein